MKECVIYEYERCKIYMGINKTNRVVYSSFIKQIVVYFNRYALLENKTQTHLNRCKVT